MCSLRNPHSHLTRLSLALDVRARLSAPTCSTRASSLFGLAALATMLFLHGCANPPAHVVVPVQAPTKVADTHGAAVYAVDPQQSELDILVYRGGTLARFGHNHVMTAKRLAGQAWIHSQFERSGFDISFQVRDLIVDDADARRAAGNDFPPEIPQSDKDGTRTNMLKPEVLDVERFPEVRVQATSVHGDLQLPQIVAGITIKDVRREVTIPVTLSVEQSRLSAQGEFEILQSDFGIKPFSAGLGALQVQDRLHIRFKIVATR
jgi:polyisoprenoid-binding protein YceI